VCFKIPDLATIVVIFAGNILADVCSIANFVIWSCESIKVELFISFEEIHGIVPFSQYALLLMDGVIPPVHLPKSPILTISD
jgi:hypothetical protein